MGKPPVPPMKTFLNLPLGLVNAHPAPGLQMRIGLPQSCGGLLLHADSQDYPAMLSAAAFWRPNLRRFQMPEVSPLETMDWALDSAGFTAMLLAKKKGHQVGIAQLFDWGLEAYLDFAMTSGAAWFSSPDLCVEKELASDQNEIDYRIDMTCALLKACLDHVWKRANQLADEPGFTPTMIANKARAPVPVLQGRSTSDYLRCAEMTFEIWERYTPFLEMPRLVGLGSMCRRDVSHPTEGIRAILRGLAGHLPAGTRVHTFGLKGTFLAELRRDFPWVASSDSMAWDSAARWSARKQGGPNTNEARIEHMTRWADAAIAQVTGLASSNAELGAQLELPLAA